MLGCNCMCIFMLHEDENVQCSIEKIVPVNPVQGGDEGGGGGGRVGRGRDGDLMNDAVIWFAWK